MRVSVEYMSLVRDAAGADCEDLTTDAEHLPLADLLPLLAERHDQQFRDSLLDCAGAMHPWLMVTINDALVRDPATPLHNGDRVTLAVPISGG